MKRTKLQSSAKPPVLDKLVVTNRSALQAKYGKKGLAKIKSALTRMEKADATRGVKLHVALLDEPTHASVPAVSSARNARENKRAIDALFKALDRPDYLMILGGPDVVPHQPMKNPLADLTEEDPDVPSDLPYACEQGYSLDVNRFLGPTRVVGRLPDIPGSRDVDYFIAVIDRASRAVQLKDKKYFGLSAQVWKGATNQNLRVGLGIAKPTFYCSPKLGPHWPGSDIGRSIHLINCHGAPQFAGFLGDGGNGQQPLAIAPTALRKQVAANAVVAAECCYGAELYAPDASVGKGMALSYLEEGAVAYLGSSNIAYGGFKANDVSEADILCSHFLAQVTAGATTGRALLAARQNLLRHSPDPIPHEVKTLAQFMLLGDPSYRAFPERAGDPVQLVAEHRARRKSMALIGTALKQEVMPTTRPVSPSVSAATVLDGVTLPRGANGEMRLVQFAPERASQTLPSRVALQGRASKAAKRAGIDLFPAGRNTSAESVAIVVQDCVPAKRRTPTAAPVRAKSLAPPRAVKSRVFVVAHMIEGKVQARRVITTR